MSSIAVAHKPQPAAAQELIHVTDDDTDNAPAIEPTMSLLVQVEGTFYFYPNNFHIGPDMSEDGRWVVYPTVSGENPKLMRLDTWTGATVPVAPDHEGMSSVISDDGRFIAFNAHGDVLTVWLWDMLTKRATRLSNPDTSTHSPAISDDGTTVAWTQRQGEDLRTVVWRDGIRRAWARGQDGIQLSADGGYLFTTDGNHGPTRLDLESGAIVPIPAFVDKFPVEANRTLSDDGTRVLTSLPYLNDYHLGGAVTVSDIGGASVLLAKHPHFDTSYEVPPAFLSGDGSTVLMSGDFGSTQGRRTASHYLVDVETGGVTRADTPFFAHPIVFSDDGSKALLYETVDFDSYRLWLLNFDRTSAPVVFTDQLARTQLTDQLRRLYRVTLQRKPSSDELLYWSRLRAGGMPLAGVADHFVSSDEFRGGVASFSDQAFLDRLMSNSSIWDGGQEWADLLSQGASRGEVAALVSDDVIVVDASNTAWPSHPKAAQIWRLYQAYYLRRADQPGLNYWLDLYWNGSELGAISDVMAASPEFIRRYGSLTDIEFVDRVYLNVLGRRADGKGKTYWVGALAAGLSRGEMMVAFSDSAEFIRKTDTLPPW